MKVDIIEENFRLDMYGFSGMAVNKDYAGTAFRLSDRMWRTIRSNELKTKGINIWVYEPDEMVFAGVELRDSGGNDGDLEHKHITLTKYAWYKHTGPYHLLKQAGLNMRNEIQKLGLETKLPYIEIYGHWNKDETKLETELLMSLK